MPKRIVNAADVAGLLYRVIPLNWLCALAKLQGRLRYRRDHAGRVVYENLVGVFGETISTEDIDLMSRQFFECERIRSLLCCLMPHMSDDALEALFPVVGEEHLGEALSRGKGAILLGSHLNSMIMLVAINLWRRRGYDIHVALPEPDDPWERTLVGRLLEKFGGRRETVLEGIGGFYCQFNIRPIVERLRKNQVICQTGDGWHASRFVEVDFLGRKLPFATGLWSTAQLTGAAVIPMFVPGAPPDGVRVLLDKPITFEKGANGEADLHRAIATYAKRLETHLLECIPVWKYWLTPQALDTWAAWPQRTLRERYKDPRGRW